MQTIVKDEKDLLSNLAAQFVKNGQRVLELGCEDTGLEKALPEFCKYTFCRSLELNLDYKFNKETFSKDAVEADLIVALEVIEYLADPISFLKEIRSYNRPLLI